MLNHIRKLGGRFIKMIIFLYGQDTYRSREELRKIIEEYKRTNPDWLDFNRIDVSNNEVEIFEQFRQTADTVSMFNQEKLIFIENIFSVSQRTQEEILEFLKKKELKKDRNTTIVFWEGENLPRAELRGKLFKFLKSKAKSQEFKPLKGVQLKNWIKDYVEEQKGKIENPAIEKLVEYVGSDLWRLGNELNKLISYKIRGTKYEIRLEDIELLVKPEIDPNIFEMVDALGYRNKNRVLKIFNQFLERREDEAYLLAMFIYQVRNLVKLKSSGRLDLHPFVIKKTRQQARNFSFDQLKKIYYQLLTIDLDIKTGKTDPKTALELFLTAL